MKKTAKIALGLVLALTTLTTAAYAATSSVRLDSWESSDQGDTIYFGTGKVRMVGSLYGGKSFTISTRKVISYWPDSTLASATVTSSVNKSVLLPSRENMYYVELKQIDGKASGTGKITHY